MNRYWPKKWDLRYAGQWALIVFLGFFWVRSILDKNFFYDFEACCPFGGLQSLATFVISGSLACTMTGMQVVMGVLLALGAIFVSKLFCGYVCPVGTISESLGRFGKKLKIKKFELHHIADTIVRSFKYVLLVIVFYFTIDSSDLFCKKFDPFFATATLFGEDVSTWMAGLAILLLLGGALFIKQFWCRYLCPLGALTNAFKYFYVFVIIALGIVLLSRGENELPVLPALIFIALVAYIFELVGRKRKLGYQLLKVQRNESNCIDCGLCDKKCPQGINVSAVKEVYHPDCNLCGDCLGACPKSNTLEINSKKRLRRVPMALTAILIIAGLAMGANLAIPTIDLRWGDEDALERSKAYEMTGIKNVKCYGSSVSFADKMKEVPGVTGTATFVKNHRVQVLYDTLALTEEQVRESIFTPKFMDLKVPENNQGLIITDYEINNFFDELDVVFMANLLAEVKQAYSFQTIYGHPVRVRIYSTPDLNIDSVATLIEEMDLVYETPDKSFSSKDLYTVKNITQGERMISGAQLKSLSFPSFKRAFNNRSNYSNNQLGQLIFPISEYPRNAQYMPYVINHLGKSNEYVVGLVSQYSSSGPVAVVFFVKDMVQEQEVVDLMLTDELTITYDNGVTEKINNPYTFEIPEKLKN